MPYGLKSTSEQIADIRESSDSGVAIVHVDTCLGSYLHDHHVRDGECLFGVYVNGATSAYDVLQGLFNEMRATSDRVPEIISGEAMKAAAEAWFAEAFGTSREALAETFDSSLEVPDEDEDDMDEACQAWFVLTWNVPRRVTNITWDKDGEEVDLPETIALPIDVNDDDAADWLADEFGWCVLSCYVEKIEKGGDA